MFSYTKCEMEVDSLERLKEEFEDLYRKIRGRTEGYGDVSQDTANRFTDLIAEPIKNLAQENQEAWGSAMMACVVAIGSISEAIKAVEWYDEKIEEIRERYETELRNSDADTRGAIETLAGPYNTEASDAWDELERMCDEAGQSLAGGDSPENIQALIEAGHISADIPFAITGDWEMFYFDPDDAENTIHDIEQAAEEGGAGYISAITAAGGHLGALSELVRRSIEAQNKGNELNENELEFLEQLFGEFEGSEDEQFLEFWDTVQNSEHLDGSVKGDLQESLSGAMLAASDDRIGGAYEHVPQDVRDVVEGPDPEAEDYNEEYHDWRLGFSPLSDFFSGAPDEIEGGTDFSAELTGTISRTIKDSLLEVESERLPVPQEEFRDMLDISTRNADANYAILTGEYPDDGGSHEFGGFNKEVDRDYILESLFKRRWHDDGEVAAQLTDWIYDYEVSDDPRQEQMSTHAAFELISALTSEELQDSLRNTGITTEGGNTNASFTELNDYIAGSMNNVFIGHIEDFSMTLDAQGNHRGDWGVIPEDLLSVNPLHEEGDYFMALDWETREDFMQFLLANDDLSPDVLAASHAHEMEYLNSALTGGNDVREKGDGNDGWTAQSLGIRAGSFSDMVNSAVAQEYNDRDMSQKEAREKYAQNLMASYEIIKNGVSAATGDKSGAVADLIFNLTDDPVTRAAERRAEDQISDDFLERDASDLFHDNDAELNNIVRLQALNVGIEEGFVLPEQIPEDLAPAGESGGLLPQDISEWETEGDATVFDSMNDVLAEITVDEDGPNEGHTNPITGDVMSTLAAYESGYSDTHQSKGDHFV